LSHGGDRYRADCLFPEGDYLDFSANINFRGTADFLSETAREDLSYYPDSRCRPLREKAASFLGVKEEELIFGGGAADLIYRFFLAAKPEKIILPVPSFSEYEKAARLSGAELIRYGLSGSLELTEKFGEVLENSGSGTAAVICSPANPTGEVISEETAERILSGAEKGGVRLLFDESFGNMAGLSPHYFLRKKYPNTVFLYSLTKLYGIAGARIGYAVSGDEAFLEKVADSGCPWQVTTQAQRLAMEIFTPEGEEYKKNCRDYIRQELVFLRSGLLAFGYKVWDSRANFVFFRAKRKDLDKRLEEYRMNIRSCGDYPGLDRSYYRVQLRSHEDNVRLLSALEEIEKDQKQGRKI
jgi:threonine-phosphate decarboxylase